MLHDARLCERLRDVGEGNLNMTLSLAWVIQQDPVPNYVRFAFSEVAPTAKCDKRATIACLGWYEQSEENSNE